MTSQSTPTRAATATCRQCGTTFTITDGRKLYCSHPCYLATKRTDLPAATEFGAFLRIEWRASEKSLSAFARQLGISRHALTELITTQRLPADKTIAKLRMYFGDRLPTVKSATEVWREQNGEVFEASRHLAMTPDARAKAAASNRGKKRNPDATAKQIQAHKTSQVWRDHLIRTAAGLRTTRRRALSSLAARLRKEPAPDDDTRRQWAGETAKNLGLTSGRILALWRPLLNRRKLASGTGRPRLVARHRVITDLMTSYGVSPSDRMPRGFWEEAFDSVSIAEGERAPRDTQSVRQWWVDHKADCAACSGSTALDEKA